MLERVHLRYQGSCVMLMAIDQEHGIYLGTAFLVHRDGYMLTASHIIPKDANLGIVPAPAEGPYTSITMEHVYPIPVEVISRDESRGVALLKLTPDLEISVPDHIMGNPAETPLGTSLMTLGYSFAHYRLHGLIVLQSILSAKVCTVNKTNILLFDNRVHSGDIGGPVINGSDERIIGITIGGFDPSDMVKDEHREKLKLSTTISQAVSIEYGIELMRQEGLELL